MIYLVPVNSGKSDDYYNEYILVNGNPELIGNTRVDLSDYYTKAQTNDLLNKKQPIGNYITSVNGNAPDESGNVEIDVQTYTAGEGIDISESGEIAVTNPMDDEQVSTRTTWSSLNVIKQLSQPFSQSGSIITCYPVEGSPLHVVSDITAVQEGTGDPSPDNVRSIKGYEKALLTQCGKNFLNLDNCNLIDCKIASITNSTIQCAINNRYFASIYPNDMPINNTAITFSQKQILPDKKMTIVEYGIKTTEANGTNTNYVTKSLGNLAYKGDGHHIELRTNRSDTAFTDTTTIIENLQLEVGTVATPFEPYRGQTYTADFGETVYGGTLDWTTGVLTKTHEYIASYQGESVGDEWISSTGLLSTGAEVLYRLDEPEVMQLSPHQILAISGTNTVYCDTGDVTVTGYEDPRHTVAQLTSRIAALESAATEI